MSENKSIVDSPHYGIAPFDPGAKREGGRISLRTRRTRRGSEMTGPGFFDPDVVTTHIEPKKAPLHRAYRFMEGTPLYRLTYYGETDDIVIPRTMEQADEMFLGRLPMSLELEMAREYLELGQRGKPVPEIVGKSFFGAFAVADVRSLEIVDGYGDPVEFTLVDMRDRRLRRDNEVLRFRRETQGQPYFLRSPRISSRRAS